MVIAYPDTPPQERNRRQAGFMIDTDLPAGTDERDALLDGYIRKIAEANAAARMFSHIALRFAPSEIKTVHPVFTWAADDEIGLIAADMGRVCQEAASREAYVDYVRRAADLGIETFRVDQAQRLTMQQLKGLLIDLPGVRWVVSTTPDDAPNVAALCLWSDVDVKLEVQAFRHGHTVHYVEKWLNEQPMWSIGLEAFRTRSGQIATPYEIGWMMNHVIAAHKSSIMVHGHDAHTNYLLADGEPQALRSQWDALQLVMKDWWAQELGVPLAAG